MGGERAKHRWKGYAPGHPACVECGEKFAIRHCQDCDDKFCVECYEKLHRAGKRRRHKFSLLRPKLHAQETYCADCDFAIGRNLWIDKSIVRVASSTTAALPPKRSETILWCV